MDHKIKTFENACESLSLNPETVISDFSFFPESERKAMIAHSKLIIIALALNEGWIPDWDNDDEYKYVPWFDMESSGSGFSDGDCDYWYSRTDVGSRLCFKSSELAKYAGTQFTEIYKDYFVK